MTRVELKHVICWKRCFDFIQNSIQFNRFVIVPVDKASNNIGIVCKFFYIQKLIVKINNSGNFQVSLISKDAIMNNYSSMLKSKYNITNTLPSLPYLFWIPKFHKTPVDFRYITSGRHTVTNVLSKQISICLKHLLNIERTNCKFLHKFDNIKNHYIIDNNKDIIECENLTIVATSKMSRHMISKCCILTFPKTN